MIERRTKTIHAASYLVLMESLRAAREKADVTQTELASRLEVDQSYISKYERTERRLDVIELRAICQALGLNFQCFVALLSKN